MTETQALAVIEVGGFAVFQGNPAELGAAIAENLAGASVDQFDLFRVKVPAGGGLSFTVPSLENPDGDEVRELLGIIMTHKVNRAYWVNPEVSEGTPPDCSSNDGINGHARKDPVTGESAGPGGLCEMCPLNVFGTSTHDGKGKACKESKSIYFLTKDNIIPMVVSAPPTSLGKYKKYMLALAGKQKTYYNVITAISLTKQKSQAGITYSEMVFTYKGDIPEPQRSALKAYRDSIVNTVNREQSASIPAADEKQPDLPY